MKFKGVLLFIIFVLIVFSVNAQVNININANNQLHKVSPYIYGRNNNFSDVFGTPTTAANIKLYQEAGLRFARENSGNNATKYNWRLKLSSHPDWYNNVYDHDWDFANETILENMPGLQVMWAFQLIGKVAANKNNNFSDWTYNRSQWWEGCAQNLAGGGVVNPNGGHDALVEGNPDLYLMDWPADSTVAILNNWFGPNGLGFPKENFIYWSMDNEPEIWHGTHDDVMPNALAANLFMESYFDVAKKARALYPGIKLTGPVCANEWQWYRYADEDLRINGKYYPWIEYFIKRVADEQKASGIRLLDVLDIHWYPSETDDAQVLQLHRVFFDEEYVYPGANGVKSIAGGWNNNNTREYIFKRINDWLDLHFGEGHGITVALTETEVKGNNPTIVALAYASMLGTFANNGVEIFTPWTWKTGMWETLHLFSRYAKNISVESISSAENTISAYSTISHAADSMTVILVNRDLVNSRTATINFEGFPMANGTYPTLGLWSLPNNETFKSHTSNALRTGEAVVADNEIVIELPPLSIIAVVLKADRNGIDAEKFNESSLKIYPNPANNETTLQLEGTSILPSQVVVFDQAGKQFDALFWKNARVHPITIDTGNFPKGIYFVKVNNKNFSSVKKLIVQ
ncbi:MAG TPA: glycoside hydrolase family 44 protein [Prolixibacteraceae bacterium]|nr:glycoside hydrolase family 44 protein [Prolixibacteraceae bacterium]